MGDTLREADGTGGEQRGGGTAAGTAPLAPDSPPTTCVPTPPPHPSRPIRETVMPESRSASRWGDLRRARSRCATSHQKGKTYRGLRSWPSSGPPSCDTGQRQDCKHPPPHAPVDSQRSQIGGRGPQADLFPAIGRKVLGGVADVGEAPSPTSLCRVGGEDGGPTFLSSWPQCRFTISAPAPEQGMATSKN